MSLSNADIVRSPARARIGRRVLIPILAIGALAVAIIIFAGKHGNTAAAKTVEVSDPVNVGCLGRVEPRDGVMRLGARSLSGQPSLVANLLPREGDAVHPGQIVAFLNSKDELEAQWREAETNVTLSQRRLEQVKAGAKVGDLHAQEAEIARLKAELANAETENRRHEALFRDRVTSREDLDLNRTQLETARQQLQEAEQRLTSLAEVRRVDVSVAEAEVASSAADARRAQAAYEAAIIRSPIEGRVIKIHAWPGEEVGNQGIMEIGQTGAMYVFAEVVEEDVHRVKVGDSATVTSSSLPQALHGTVEQIGMKVARDDVLHLDPDTLSDTRVVETKIRLDEDESERAASLIHAQVNVVISPKR